MVRWRIVGERTLSEKLIDPYGRTIDYLRLSVTDRCDLRCRYCMPSDGVEFIEHIRILSYEQIELLVRAFVDLGVRKVRITGGEPLIRKGIDLLFDMLGSFVPELTLTTNGTLLNRYAPVLVKAGVKRINISLDTLRRETYRYITGRDSLSLVLQGIETAVNCGLRVKLNTVMMRGINDSEVTNLIHYAAVHRCDIRFIEVMPQEHTGSFSKTVFIASSDVKKIVSGNVVLVPVVAADSSTEVLYHFDTTSTKVGFISPMSSPFCGRCNKLRLMPNGTVKTCLFGEGDINLKNTLENGFSIDEIKQSIRQAVARKPAAYRLDADNRALVMNRTGG
jgi:cyclic pyranopterin phosphate synthase